MRPPDRRALATRRRSDEHPRLDLLGRAQPPGAERARRMAVALLRAGNRRMLDRHRRGAVLPRCADPRLTTYATDATPRIVRCISGTRCVDGQCCSSAKGAVLLLLIYGLALLVAVMFSEWSRFAHR